MAKTPNGKKTRRTSNHGSPNKAGNGGETHQTPSPGGPVLTTNQGTPISDNQNSLRAGTRGPTLLEDFIFREKITHFDHERIPERIVHARGSGAHGYFQPYQSMSKLTRAAFLQDPKVKTPVFVRFSTVAGGAGLRRHAARRSRIRGQVLHVRRELRPGRQQHPGLLHPGCDQVSRHHPLREDGARSRLSRRRPRRTTRSGISSTLMPESMHMLLWAMSDRTLPRSLRMMEGFGVHTFRFVNADGKSTFVKFHWRPKIGSASLIWDESVKLLRRRSRLAAPRSLRRHRDGRFSGVRVLGAGVRREDRREISVRRARRDEADSRRDGPAHAARPDGARPQSR